MLLFGTTVKHSKKGYALFSDEYIPEETVIWRFDPRFDLFFDPAQVESFPKIQKELIKSSAYISKLTCAYVLSLDNTRFVSRSKNPNIDNLQVMPGETEICWIATKNIYPEDELTLPL